MPDVSPAEKSLQRSDRSGLESGDADLGSPPAAQPRRAESNLVVELANSTDMAVSTDPTRPAATIAQSVPADRASAQLNSSDQAATSRTASVLGLAQVDSDLLPVTPSVDDLQAVLEQVERQGLAASPAVLQVRFTAMPKSQQADLDGYLDLTLVSPKAPVQAKRVEVSRERFAGLLKALYRQLSRQEVLAVENPDSPTRQLHDLLVAPLQVLGSADPDSADRRGSGAAGRSLRSTQRRQYLLRRSLRLRVDAVAGADSARSSEDDIPASACAGCLPVRGTGPIAAGASGAATD